ncbi:MAG: CopG family transcriptional regulator [archaeon GB-1867-005]|nr:CopG family transcriptional regulator [Candidatus Culexmicrobium cathedralense]
MSEEKVAIYIPKELYDKIVEEVEKSKGEFKSVEEYVKFVLEELLKEEEDEYVYTPEEEEEIKKRLRALGYIG